MDRRFDVCMLIFACFCACVNTCVIMTQLGGCQVSKDTKDLGGYLGTYPITRKGADRWSIPMRIEWFYVDH